jgi:predicted Zn-dependent protease
MPNINLLPHPERDVPLEELISGVRRGILIDGDGSFSIDQQRYNAQFGGQVFHEIRDGRVVGMLKDVAYQIRTPEFWNSMDLIGGREHLLPGRRLQRRQGAAVAVQRRLARLRARRGTGTSRHQHGSGAITWSPDT